MNECEMYLQETRRSEPIVEKKERAAKTKAREEQKEMRREKKVGRKRVN